MRNPSKTIIQVVNDFKTHVGFEGRVIRAKVNRKLQFSSTNVEGQSLCNSALHRLSNDISFTQRPCIPISANEHPIPRVESHTLSFLSVHPFQHYSRGGGGAMSEEMRTCGSAVVQINSLGIHDNEVDALW